MYKRYTEVDGLVLALAAGERIISISMLADGAGDMTCALANFSNLTASLATCPKGKAWSENWAGAVTSDGTGTITFTNLGHYEVQTVQ